MALKWPVPRRLALGVRDLQQKGRIVAPCHRAFAVDVGQEQLVLMASVG